MDKEEYRSRLERDIKMINRGDHGSIFYDSVLSEGYSREMAPIVAEHLADENDTVRAETVLFLDKVGDTTAADEIRNMDIRSSYVLGVACMEYLEHALEGDRLVYALLSMFDRSINNELNYELVLHLQDIAGPEHRDHIWKLFERTAYSKKVYLRALIDRIDGNIPDIESMGIVVDNSEYDEQVDADGGLQKSFLDFISRNGYRIRALVH